MGLFSGVVKDAPPTATDPVEDSASDPEKAPIPVQQEDAAPHTPAHHHVSPEVEKRVVRKLDLRFTSLVGFLCTIPAYPYIQAYPLTVFSPSFISG